MISTAGVIEMHCWSCGDALSAPGTYCERCGAPPPVVLDAGRGPAAGLRVCTRCGYRGEGVQYFQRASHLGWLAGISLFTYGVGGLLFWAIKRRDFVCPSCGQAWERSRSLGPALAVREVPPSRSDPEVPGTTALPKGETRTDTESLGEGLPPSGGARRALGVLLALVAVLLLGLGIADPDTILVAISLALGLAGAASFGWGWSARRERRAALMRRLQSRVLRLASEEGGVLTATRVASALDLSLDGAEQVLLSLDDGFRIRSEVTSEGLLVFEFPELRPGGRGASGAGLSPPPDHPSARPGSRGMGDRSARDGEEPAEPSREP